MIYSEFVFAHQVPHNAVGVLGQDGAHDSSGHEVALGDFEVLCDLQQQCVSKYVNRRAYSEPLSLSGGLLSQHTQTRTKEIENDTGEGVLTLNPSQHTSNLAEHGHGPKSAAHTDV